MGDGRRVTVNKVGAGDPTFFLDFNLEVDDKEEMEILVTLSPKGRKAVSFGYTGKFSSSPSITLGKVFTRNDWNDSPEAAAATSYKIDFIFKEGNKEIISFEGSSTPLLFPRAVDLSLSQIAALHFVDDQEKGDLTFLHVYKKKGLDMRSSFISADGDHMWAIIPLSDNIYHIYNQKRGLYLCDTDQEGVILMSSDASDKSISKWKITKVTTDNGAEIYQIKNRCTKKYLSTNPEKGKVKSSNSSNKRWYFHINNLA